jgi:hypothetical protein
MADFIGVMIVETVSSQRVEVTGIDVVQLAQEKMEDVIQLPILPDRHHVAVLVGSAGKLPFAVNGASVSAGNKSEPSVVALAEIFKRR